MQPIKILLVGLCCVSCQRVSSGEKTYELTQQEIASFVHQLGISLPRHYTVLLAQGFQGSGFDRGVTRKLAVVSLDSQIQLMLENSGYTKVPKLTNVDYDPPCLTIEYEFLLPKNSQKTQCKNIFEYKYRMPDQSDITQERIIREHTSVVTVKQDTTHTAVGFVNTSP